MLQSQQYLAPGLERKLQKLQELRVDSHSLTEALNHASSLDGLQLSTDRHSLRESIDQMGGELNQKVLTITETVMQALQQVQEQAQGISSTWDKVASCVSDTRNKCNIMMSETDRIENSLQALEKRSQLLESFSRDFQLSADDRACLQSGDIGPDLFNALARTQAIHSRCRSVVRQQHHRAGLELMDQMSRQLDVAYDRLCRWVQTECQALADVDAPDVPPLLSQATTALKARPVLYKHCAEQVCDARTAAVYQRFIVALSKGGPGGVPRPLEAHQRDAYRFIGDMLAWMHQTIASERDILKQMFGDIPDTKNTTNKHVDPQQSHSSQPPIQDVNMAALSGRVLQSVSGPLDVRVTAALHSRPPMITCLKLVYLLSFYQGLMLDYVDESAVIVTILAKFTSNAQQQVNEGIKSITTKLLRDIQAPPLDLQPPQHFSSVVRSMMEVMTVVEQSIGASNSQSDNDDVSHVITQFIDALLHYAQSCAEKLGGDDGLTGAVSADLSRIVNQETGGEQRGRVFVLNCASALSQALAGREWARAQADRVAGVIQTQSDALIQRESNRLLEQCGLRSVVERMKLYTLPETRGTDGVMAQDAALAVPVVVASLDALYRLVSTQDQVPEFQTISLPKLRSDVVSRLLHFIAEQHEFVYSQLGNSSNGFKPQSQATVRHTPAEVRTIFGI